MKTKKESSSKRHWAFPTHLSSRLSYFALFAARPPAQITRSVGTGPRHPLKRRGASLVLAFYPSRFLNLPFQLCFSPAQSNPGRAFCKAFPAGQKNLFAQASPLFCIPAQTALGLEGPLNRRGPRCSSFLSFSLPYLSFLLRRP